MRCKFLGNEYLVLMFMYGLMEFLVTVFLDFGLGLLACLVEFDIIMSSNLRIIYGCRLW